MKRTAALILLTGAAVAIAQTSAPDGRVTVQQKEEFVRKLLDDPAAAERIKASRDKQAAELLSEARDYHQHAQSLIRAGDLAGAEKFLDRAIGHAGKARQLAPDAGRRTIAERFEFSRLLGGVESLRASYVRHRPKSDGTPTSRGFDAEIERVDALIDDARTLAAADQVGAAIKAAQHAERGLITGLSRLLGSATILYSQRFDTPAEEFAYELERNRSYEELVPVAIGELKPPAQAVRGIEGHVARNQGLREQAKVHAQRQDHPAAMRALRSGTEQLQRALALAGVVVPSEMPPEPPATK